MKKYFCCSFFFVHNTHHCRKCKLVKRRQLRAWAFLPSSYTADSWVYRITSCQIDTLLVCVSDRLMALPFYHHPTCGLTKSGTRRYPIPSVVGGGCQSLRPRALFQRAELLWWSCFTAYHNYCRMSSTTSTTSTSSESWRPTWGKLQRPPGGHSVNKETKA